MQGLVKNNIIGTRGRAGEGLSDSQKGEVVKQYSCNIADRCAMPHYFGHQLVRTRSRKINKRGCQIQIKLLLL